MNKILITFLLLISPTLVFASTEISTPATNLGIGTTSVANALSISSTLAIGDSTYTNVAAPTGGIIAQGAVGIGTTNPTGGNSQYVLNTFNNANALRMNVVKNPNTGVSAAAGYELQTADTNSYWRQYSSTSTNAVNASSTTLTSETGYGINIVATNGKIKFITGDGANTGQAVIITNDKNVGIGTITPGNLLAVGSTGQFNVQSGGNVGIGSLTPGTALDVQGVARASGGFSGNSTTATALAANGANCSAGNYPLGVDASGAAESCTAAGGGSNWITTNVGIGTFVGNVGIGTVTYGSKLVVMGGVGIGTTGSSLFVVNAAPLGGMMIEKNVGIGTTTPSNALQVNNTFGFSTQFTNSNIGIGTSTVSWLNGNMQNVGLGTFQGAYLAFTDPTGGVKHVELKMLQDSTGSRKIDFWPAKVKWVGGVIPVLSTTAAAIDFLNCTYDGNYYCQVTTGYQ